MHFPGFRVAPNGEVLRRRSSRNQIHFANQPFALNESCQSLHQAQCVEQLRQKLRSNSCTRRVGTRDRRLHLPPQLLDVFRQAVPAGIAAQPSTSPETDRRARPGIRVTARAYSRSVCRTCFGRSASAQEPVRIVRTLAASSMASLLAASSRSSHPASPVFERRAKRLGRRSTSASAHR